MNIKEVEETEQIINSVIIDSAFKDTVDRAKLYKTIKYLHDLRERYKDIMRIDTSGHCKQSR